MNSATSLSSSGIADRFASHAVVLPDDAVEGIRVYLEFLMKWNKAMNLVGATTWEKALDDLVLDSVYLAAFVQTLPVPEHPVCWDIGAGAGLPGIPLRILWRQGLYTMVEAREKRALFMRTVLAALPLPGTFVFAGRVENFFGKGPAADMVVSRAFMPWEKMLALIAPHLAPCGKMVFLMLEPAPSTLPAGWRVVGSKGYTAGGKQRYFWCLEHCNVEQRPLQE